MARILLCRKCYACNRVPAERLQDNPKCGKCKTQLQADAILDANNEMLASVIENSPIPVVVDFWAPWCGPCVAFAPTFKEYAEQNLDRALFVKLNTENFPEPSSRLGIRGIPTLVVFRDGKEVGRQSGAMSQSQLKVWLKSFV